MSFIVWLLSCKLHWKTCFRKKQGAAAPICPHSSFPLAGNDPHPVGRKGWLGANRASWVLAPSWCRARLSWIKLPPPTEESPTVAPGTLSAPVGEPEAPTLDQAGVPREMAEGHQFIHGMLLPSTDWGAGACGTLHSTVP